MEMECFTVACRGLQPPSLKLHKIFIYGDKGVALVPKDLSTTLQRSRKNLTPIYVKMLRVTQVESSTSNVHRVSYKLQLTQSLFT